MGACAPAPNGEQRAADTSREQRATDAPREEPEEGAPPPQHAPGDADPQPFPVPPGARAIAIRRLSQTTEPPYADTTVRAIVDRPSDWARMWQYLTQRYQTSPPVPPIDFSRERVVVVVDPQHTSTGFGLAVRAAFASPDTLYLILVRSAPGAYCPVGGMLTVPADVVVLPRGPAAVAWTSLQHEGPPCR